MESKKTGVKRGASWEVPQQSRLIAAKLRDVFKGQAPRLTVSFIKKESSKYSLWY